MIVQQLSLQLLCLEHIRCFRSQSFPIPLHIRLSNPSVQAMQAMIQVYLLNALDSKHFQLLVLLYRLEDLIFRLSQSNRFPHIDSWAPDSQSGLHLMPVATFLRRSLIPLTRQACQLDLVDGKNL